MSERERRFLKAARENPSGIYNSKNRDLLPQIPQIANAKMMKSFNKALNNWSPDVRNRITDKDAEILMLQ